MARGHCLLISVAAVCVSAQVSWADPDGPITPVFQLETPAQTVAPPLVSQYDRRSKTEEEHLLKVKRYQSEQENINVRFYLEQIDGARRAGFEVQIHRDRHVVDFYP